MKIPFKTALIFTSVFVILKLILFQTGKHGDLYVLVVFGNILCLLMTMIFGIYSWKKVHPEKRGYTDDVKITMQSAAYYLILVSAFSYLFYSTIDKNFVQQRVEERVEIARKADFEELKKQNPEKLQDKTREDFIDDEKEQAELWFSPFFLSTMVLVGGMIMAFFYSLVIAWGWRKFFENQLVRK